MDILYKDKYIKYKKKYLNLQNQLGGLNSDNLKNNINIIDNDVFNAQKNIISILQKIDNSTSKKLKYEITKLNTINKNITLFINNITTFINELDKTQQTILFKYMGEGAFGCVFSPPTLILNSLKQDQKIIQQFPRDRDLIDFSNYNNNDYVAKILSYQSYVGEFKENQVVLKYDSGGEYTPKMIFAGYMNKSHLNYLNSKSGILQKLIKLTKCFNEKFKSDVNWVGYIIYTQVGKSLDQITLDDINKNNIKEVLSSLSDGIRNFIHKLYLNNYIHADIKAQNMTLKNNKIYFIDFGNTDDYTKAFSIPYQNFTYYCYPFHLFLFNILFNEMKISIANKYLFKYYFSNIIEKIETYQLLNNNIRNMLINQKTPIFNNMKEVKTYFTNFINTLLDNNLNDTNNYNISTVYNKCFLPIIKNIDIYSLCLTIYLMFNTNISDQKIHSLHHIVTDNTNNLIKELYMEALNNKIKNPIDLANRLDKIIQTI